MDYSKHTKLSMKDKMAAEELGRARNYGLDDPSVCEFAKENQLLTSRLFSVVNRKTKRKEGAAEASGRWRACS